MESKILVGLRPRDQIAELIPWIDTMAGPGMKLVCLVRYPVDPWEYLRNHCVTTESTRAAVAAGKKLLSRYSWEAQQRLAEQKIAPLRNAMNRKSVSVEVDLYTGSLLATVMERISDRNVHWVIVPTRAMNRSSGLVETAITPFACFKWALLCSRTPAATIL